MLKEKTALLNIQGIANELHSLMDELLNEITDKNYQYSDLQGVKRRQGSLINSLIVLSQYIER